MGTSLSIFIPSENIRLEVTVTSVWSITIIKSFDNSGLRIWVILLGKNIDQQRYWARVVNAEQSAHREGRNMGNWYSSSPSAHNQDQTEINTKIVWLAPLHLEGREYEANTQIEFLSGIMVCFLAKVIYLIKHLLLAFFPVSHPLSPANVLYITSQIISSQVCLGFTCGAAKQTRLCLIGFKTQVFQVPS